MVRWTCVRRIKIFESGRCQCKNYRTGEAN